MMMFRSLATIPPPTQMPEFPRNEFFNACVKIKVKLSFGNFVYISVICARHKAHSLRSDGAYSVIFTETWHDVSERTDEILVC